MKFVNKIFFRGFSFQSLGSNKGPRCRNYYIKHFRIETYKHSRRNVHMSNSVLRLTMKLHNKSVIVSSVDRLYITEKSEKKTPEAWSIYYFTRLNFLVQPNIFDFRFTVKYYLLF